MAGVTGVVMTLSLILMISSATELIRFAFNYLKLTFFKLFESFCIDEGAVFFNSAFNIVHLSLKPMDKDFPLKSSCGLLLIRNIDSKIYVTTINVSTKSYVTQYFYLVDGKYHCLMLSLIYSSMQEILL